MIASRGFRFTWDSVAGEQATKRLEAWGAREREILATGDPSAIPSGGYGGPVGHGGTDGKPGDMPGIWDLAMDVDVTLTEYRPGSWLRELLLFVYRDGLDTDTSLYRYDLDRFECEVLDAAIEAFYSAPKSGRFWRYRRKFLERARFDFAEYLAYQRRLGEFGAKRAG